jgi:4-amino-4-deoxy-L-arabinose transferase-like glycosyltransferase
VLWLSQPVVPNASALKPRAPNFEVYPFNDAQVYDEFAQSALVGNGFGDDKIPQRPLYVVFLMLSHVLVGQNYNNVIFFQTLVFAFFPVLIYLFGREFFGRPIGISIALFAILRDYISNFVSPFTGNLSYSKLYLSEIPTAILLILFLLIGVRWIKAGFPLYSGFLLGGILGIAMLIRTQVIVALPVIILFTFLTRPKDIKPLIKSAILMVITIMLVVSPWLWRNWKLTGELIFDSPESQIINLALRYSRLNGFEPQALPLPGESNVKYIARLNQIVRNAIVSNPL